MCGICGYLSFTDQPPDPERLARMCDLMAHRGPDDQGHYLDGPMGFGHRRLSIIDLATGHQPLLSEDGKVALVVNGEFYNFRELREGLQAKGHRFRSQSDSEVAVHLYEEWGTDFVERLHGMFALALWDARRRRLVLATDRPGKKPLFYHCTPERFVFASTLAALRSEPSVPTEVDEQALDGYLSYGFVPHPLTIYRDVRKLPAARVAVVDGDSGLSVSSYWSPVYHGRRSDPEEALTDELETLLRDAVSKRLVSDVPLGAFLSGGIDSALVVALMGQAGSIQPKTFTVGFDQATFSELPQARASAGDLGAEHHEFVVPFDVKRLLPEMVWHFGEPFADSSALAVWHVSQQTRQHVTVALSGDGGDEVFAGYRRYRARQLARTYNRLPRWLRRTVVDGLASCLRESDAYTGRSAVKKLKRFLESARMYEDHPHRSFLSFFTDEDKQRLYSPAMAERVESLRTEAYLEQFWQDATDVDEVTRMMFVDLKTYLTDDILVKVDTMSMAHALEVRCPLLDHRVVEFMAALPLAMKLRGSASKYLLRRVAERYVSAGVVRRSKQGFVVPVSAWMQQELGDHLLETVNEVREPLSQFVQPDAVEELLVRHRQRERDWSQQLWALLVLALWLRQSAVGGTRP